MNEPIISPWLFYWIETVNTLITIFGVIGTLLGIVFLVTVCLSFVPPHAFEDEENTPKIIKKIKKISSVSIFFVLLAIFTPSSDTIYKMIIAKNVTPSNIERAVEAGKDFKDEIKKDIFDLINKFKDEKKGEKETTK